MMKSLYLEAFLTTFPLRACQMATSIQTVPMAASMSACARVAFISAEATNHGHEKAVGSCNWRRLQVDDRHGGKGPDSGAATGRAWAQELRQGHAADAVPTVFQKAVSIANGGSWQRHGGNLVPSRSVESKWCTLSTAVLRKTWQSHCCKQFGSKQRRNVDRQVPHMQRQCASRSRSNPR